MDILCVFGIVKFNLRSQALACCSMRAKGSFPPGSFAFGEQGAWGGDMTPPAGTLHRHQPSSSGQRPRTPKEVVSSSPLRQALFSHISREV